MLFYKKKTLRLVTAMCNRALDGDLLILATYPGGALELREKIKDVLFLDSYRDDYFKEEFELLLFYGDVLQFYDLHFKGLHHEAYAKFKCLDLQDWEFSRNAFRKFPNLILAFMRTLHFLSSNNPNRLYQEKLNQEVKDLFEYCTTADVDLSKVGSTLVRLENQINCKTKNY
ncbi:uncharacterized protein LOC135121716 [Zophobas morio]|uniref:uncharacterized protein LOC135121716 n=1 Tax=Zophobas morio TaxID=2755281 RepID=UPI00308279B6